MATLREKDEQTARKKGLLAGAAVAASVGVGVVASSAVLTVVGLVPAAYLAYDWFTYRAKRGMRF